MPTITVQAADSATAMDEIWEKLGPRCDDHFDQQAQWPHCYGSNNRKC